MSSVPGELLRVGLHTLAVQLEERSVQPLLQRLLPPQRQGEQVGERLDGRLPRATGHVRLG